jgi:hypothetical protein
MLVIQVQARIKLMNQMSVIIDVFCKTDGKPSDEHFFGTTGLNIKIDNVESFDEVVSVIIVDDLF